MWVVKHKPNQSHWDIVKSNPKRRHIAEDAGMVQAENCQAVSQNACPAPMPPPPKVRRTPAPDEPLAFCAKCGQWTPMLWLPKEERGHTAETWFECEYCGCRELKLRYIVRS